MKPGLNRRENRLRSRGALQRLEPDDGKLSRPVLRGGSGGNAALLPDRLLFKCLRIPNFASTPPCGILTWKKLPPPDILFRLAALAGFNVVLYWLPIYYWTTYEPGDDDRSGMLLFYSMGLSPIFWILGMYCYCQAWLNRQSMRHRPTFYITSTLLLLAILSNLPRIMQFYVRT